VALQGSELGCGQSVVVSSAPTDPCRAGLPCTLASGPNFSGGASQPSVHLIAHSLLSPIDRAVQRVLQYIDSCSGPNRRLHEPYGQPNPFRCTTTYSPPPARTTSWDIASFTDCAHLDACTAVAATPAMSVLRLHSARATAAPVAPSCSDRAADRRRRCSQGW
jgi:hypothetical protein